MSDIDKIKIDGQLYDIADTQLREEYTAKMEDVDEDVSNLQGAVTDLQNAGYKKITASNIAPTSEQGADGDIWLIYEV